MKKALFLFLVIISLSITSFSKTNISNMQTSSKVILKSSDGYIFEVDETISSESFVIQNMLADDPSNEGTILPNVNGTTLAKVVEYYQKYFEAPMADDNNDEFESWEMEFVKVDHCTLFSLIVVTDEFQFKKLYDLTAGTVGKMILGKSTEEIRQMFNITSVTSPGEDMMADENKRNVVRES